MRAWLRSTLPFLLVITVALPGCVPTWRVRVREVEVAATAIEQTLGLFVAVATLQARQPSVDSQLLMTNPRDPLRTLRSLNLGFEAYQERLAEETHLRPIVLFMPHGADVDAEARRRGLVLDFSPGEAPPLLLSGHGVDILVIFQPMAMTQSDLAWGRPVILARTASTADAMGFLAAQGTSVDPLDRRLYRVIPGQWKKSVAAFEHTRCGRAAPGMKLVTKLTYQGGVTKTLTTPLTDTSWRPCTLLSQPGLRAATVTQPSSKRPGRPVIIAASYFLDPYPGVGLAQWIEVQ